MKAPLQAVVCRGLYDQAELAAHAAAHEAVYPVLGARIIDRFDYWNACAFAFELPLMPVQFVPVLPYGCKIGLASHCTDAEGGRIKLQNRRRAGFTLMLDLVLYAPPHPVYRGKGLKLKRITDRRSTQ